VDVELSLRPRSSIWSAALSPLRLASREEGLSSLFREGEDEDAVLKKDRSSRTNLSLLDGVGAAGVGRWDAGFVGPDVSTNCAARGLGCFSACLEIAAERGGDG
jgi:hypothetical protein